MQFLVAFLHSCSQRLQQQPDEVPEQQDRQFLDASQMSTFLLSYRPSFITKSCDFLTCTVSMDGEEGVRGSRVKWGRLSTCKQVVDGYLRRARDLQLLKFWRVVLLVLHQLIQKGLVLFLRPTMGENEFPDTEVGSQQRQFFISLSFNIRYLNGVSYFTLLNQESDLEKKVALDDPHLL